MSLRPAWAAWKDPVSKGAKRGGGWGGGKEKREGEEEEEEEEEDNVNDDTLNVKGNESK